MSEQRWGVWVDGKVFFTGETGRMYCERHAPMTWIELKRPGPRFPTTEPTTERVYTIAQLTRALAETDPELVAVATRAAEGDQARLERCLATAVERDEAGARTRAEKLVARARERLGR